MCKTKSDWEQCVDFHGHECPGLAIGYRAALAAWERLGLSHATDEELVCVTENDSCGVDAVQVLLGCSVGKGNLVFRDTGKMAYSFFSRKSNKRLRVLFTMSLNKNGVDRAKRQEIILHAPAGELFTFMEPSFNPPEPAQIFTSVVCERCGEAAPEPKIRLHEGKKVCLDCYPVYSRGWQS